MRYEILQPPRSPVLRGFAIVPIPPTCESTPGRQLLDTLCSDYLQPEGSDGILAHGCAYKKQGIGIDEAMIWGDYYFLQALWSAHSSTGNRGNREPEECN